MRVPKKRIQRIASELLRKHRVHSPPVPVERILKEIGIDIVLRSMDDDVSGFLFNRDSKAVVGINSFHPMVRQRFTMAHELGHYILHEADMHIDETDFQVLHYRDAHSQHGTDPQEREANLFAAELLMPRSMLESELRDVHDLSLHDDAPLKALAKKFGVSNQALVIRLTSLHLLDATMFGLV